MALESGTYISDLVATNPDGASPKSSMDDHLRLMKTTLKNSLAGFTGPILVTGTDGGAADAYTLTPATAVPAYVTKMLIEFTPAATNLTTTPTLNISGLGTKTIKSVANAALVAGDLVVSVPTLLTYDGTNMRLLGPTKNYIDQVAMSAALPAGALGFLRNDGAGASAFTQTHTGYAQKEVKGADIVCAATIDLTAATGNLVHVTGSTGPVTAFTVASGAEYTIVWDGTPTITHSATLILPTAGNLTVAAGDVWKVRGDGAAARVVDIEKADGAALTVTTPGMILLATLTPTASPYVDFLTTFTASYDSYLIKGHGIQGLALDNLRFRFANAGVVNSGANYYMTVDGTSVTAETLAQVSVENVEPTGIGVNFNIVVSNANDSVKLKSAIVDAMMQTNVTPTFAGYSRGVAYKAASTISGIRFFWGSGTTFVAQGKIRIYGISKT